jgi:geranylgeranyl transferase type-1 subunit beta
VISNEKDIRFLFCACAISYILNDWSGIDVSLALNYIDSSQSYDGGFGQGPFEESHGGSTYCALASLWLMNEITNIKNKRLLVEWLVSRQDEGFHGRINKPDDTCYSFWIGASLDVHINLLQDVRYLSLCG